MSSVTLRRKGVDVSEIENLRQAIMALEGQRAALGHEVAEAALAPLRVKLAELEGAEVSQGQQRRLVTVVFADITGSTELSRGLEPEEILEMMDGALRRLAEPVDRHGGRVTRFMGDGLMAVFGLPIAQENDALRAVWAGLDILEAARRYSEELGAEGIEGFDVRVGVSTGLVAAGGFSEAGDTIMGLAVNLGARLEGAAPAGGVLISQGTFNHVRRAFEVEPLEAISAKGFDEPVPVYLVKRAKPPRFRGYRRGVRGVETRMVGREAELESLQGALEAAVRDARTSIVTVIGEAGVGKSRLIFEFEQRVARWSKSPMVFKGRASPQMATTPFSLLRDMLARWCSILQSDPAPEVRDKLEAGLAGFWEDEPIMKAHFVGALVGYDFSDSPHLRGVRDDAKEVRARAQFYLGQMLAEAARRDPALILLEDIHWADGASLEAISRFAAEWPRLGLLVIALARPRLFERHPDWGQQEGTGEAVQVRLDLAPLSSLQSQELVGEILRKVEALPEVFRQRIVDAGEGNPFYIEELITMMLDDGVIVEDRERDVWQLLVAEPDDLRMPSTLTAVLQARLDGLPGEEKAVLQQAAIVGRSFWSDALQRIREFGEPPTAQLTALSDRELVYPQERSTFANSDEYAFKHARMREVAYDTLFKRVRERYHGLAADWLVERTSSSGRSDEYSAIIAEHFRLAGRATDAGVWFLRAGERAEAQGVPVEARGFHDLALELLPESDRERRWRAIKGRLNVLMWLGEMEEVTQGVAALIALAKEMGDDNKQAEAYQYQGAYFRYSGDFREELAAYERALDAARRGASQRLEAETLGFQVGALTRAGDMDSAAITAEEALECAHALGDEAVLEVALSNAAVFYSTYGDIGRAVELVAQQLASSRKRGSRSRVALGLCDQGYFQIQLGMYSMAIDALECSLEQATAAGFRRCASYARLNLGLAQAGAGDAAAAIETLEASHLYLAALEDRFGLAAQQMYLGLAKEAAGDVAGALAAFELARETFEEIGVQGCTIDARAGQARCLLSLENRDAALQYATEVWHFLTEHGALQMEFPILAFETCGDVFESARDGEQARRAISMGYRELMQRADKIGDLAWQTSFLENVPVHRRLEARWKRLEAAGEGPLPGSDGLLRPD